MGYWFNRSNYPITRYLAAKLVRPGGDVYISLTAGIQNDYATSGTYLNIIEVKPMDGGSVTVSSAASSGPAPTPSAAGPVAASAPPAAMPARGAVAALAEIPAGTMLTVRMRDSIDSQRDKVGQTFRASLDQPIYVNGNLLAPRGAAVTIRLVDDRQSGKLAGRTVLTVAAVSLNVNGRNVDIDAGSVAEKSESRGERSAKVIGGTAAAGGLIGALGGGRKGAAIGAGSGAAAGTAVQLVTKGQKVRIPSEARLTFILQQPAQF
jgi:hypothetical protein